MKITNNLNLPEPLYLAICGDTYSAGDSDISTTSLSVPSRIWALRKLHNAELTTDASDRIYSLIGQVAHGICERMANNPDFIAEQRYYRDFDGVKVGGQIDLLQKSTRQLYDFKITSHYASQDGAKDEWVAQASVNRMLLEHNGISVSGATYIAIFRDFSKTRAGIGGMPLLPVMKFEIPLWSIEQTEAWVRGRIASHYAALKTLPECTEEERWAKPATFACMKPGAQRATRVFDTEAEAIALAKDGKVEVVRRPGANTRCESYCEVKDFCSFWKNLSKTR